MSLRHVLGNVASICFWEDYLFAFCKIFFSGIEGSSYIFVYTYGFMVKVTLVPVLWNGFGPKLSKIHKSYVHCLEAQTFPLPFTYISKKNYLSLLSLPSRENVFL